MKFKQVGLIIDNNQIHINPTKIKAITWVPGPSDLKQLQSFLDGINYYSKFILSMVKIVKPPYRLIKKMQKGNGPK